MATGTDKVKVKLAALTSSFDDLEALLEPLFSQTLPETLVGLEPLQQAKLQTVLPYLVYDLIFSASNSHKMPFYHEPNVKCLSIVSSFHSHPIDHPVYLKSRGIDPKTHPVIPELVRYLSRVMQPSDATKSTIRTESDNTLKKYPMPRIPPPVSPLFSPSPYTFPLHLSNCPITERTEIDKAAASRFIKHAIAQAQWKKTAAEEMQEDDGPSAATTSASRVPVKITQKMRERADYEKEVKEQDARGSEDDELEVFEDERQNNEMDVDMADRSTKGKGKEIPADAMPPSRNKRRRPAIDPFTGKLHPFYFFIRIF